MCFPTLSKVSQLILNSPFKELSGGGIGCVFLHHLQPARPLLWAIYHAVSQSSIFRNWAYIISNGRVFLWRFYFLVVELNTANAFLCNLRNDANTFSGPFYGKSGQILKVKSKTRYSSRKNANISMQYFYTCVKTNSTDKNSLNRKLLKFSNITTFNIRKRYFERNG